jgi:hypothetical protein
VILFSELVDDGHLHELQSRSTIQGIQFNALAKEAKEVKISQHRRMAQEKRETIPIVINYRKEATTISHGTKKEKEIGTCVQG